MYFLQSKEAFGLASLLLATTVAPVFGSPLAYHHQLPRAGNSTGASNSTVNPKVLSAANVTADTAQLKTWWHNSGEINTQTPVGDDNVRQSHVYDVQVSTSGTYYNSFVYETIPRNGNGNICTPGDLSSVCNVDDQITIEPIIGMDMAWSEFLYSTEATVKITRKDGGSVSPSNVVIRPTTLGFAMGTDGDALTITVPYSENGYRFSVEFQDALWEFHNGGTGENSHYVQNKVSSGEYYVSSYTDDMPLVGVEPLHSLLIFASAFPSSDMVPANDTNAYHPQPGLVSNLGSVTQSVIYFDPGVYYMTGSNHAILSDSTTWVYFAPGAYVKGAIEWQSQSKDLRATGHGVLSGEQYVYQANTAQGYKNVKSDDSSLKMWRGESADGMIWTLQGVTLNAPPFNSMDFYGNDQEFSVRASDYKQVGAYFGQTDGIEIYPGSQVHDIFYHIGDDGIKTYYSDVNVERVVVWKTCNAPIVQFGWYSRDVSNVVVDSVDIIHTRYISQAAPYPRNLIASAASYLDLSSTSDADTSMSLSDYTISNWRCEGLCPGLFGINPLQNIDTMTLKNIWIEKMDPATTQLDQSVFTVFTDSSNGNKPIQLGANSPNGIGLVIEDFTVGTEKITIAANNWQSNATGCLDIDKSYWGKWSAS